MKVLKDFHEGKCQTLSFEMDTQRQKMQKEFTDKEDEMAAELRKANAALAQQKELAGRLKVEIANFQRKLSAYANPQSETVTREELRIAEEGVRVLELRANALSRQLQDESDENERLQKEVKAAQRSASDLREELVKSESEFRQQLAKVESEFRHKQARFEVDFQEQYVAREADLRGQFLKSESELRASFTASESELREQIATLEMSVKRLGEVRSRLGDLHSKLSESTTCRAISRDMNRIFAIVDFDPVEIVDNSRFWGIRSTKIFEAKPEIQERFANLGGMLRQVQHELGRFPIELGDFPSEHGDELEGQIDHVLRIIEILRDSFDQQQAEIEDLKSVNTSQHSALLQISDSPRRALDNI
jgi:chromosome segregation ATPase